MSAPAPLLLSIVELGGYANFSPLYQRLGYRHETVRSGRRAISELKKSHPDTVVTEFNIETNFRDRTSSLESILAQIHTLSIRRVVVFYHREDEALLDKLYQRFPIFLRLAYPVGEAALEGVLSE